MKRIEDIIQIKRISLDDIQVKFQVKLLQYQLNNIIYQYKNKYALKEYIKEFIDKLVQAIKDSNLIGDEQAKELLKKTKEIILKLRLMSNADTITKEDISQAVDSTIKYILYQYTNNKEKMTTHQQLDMLNEIKLIKDIIRKNNLNDTPRITNAYRLQEQLKVNIIEQL